MAEQIAEHIDTILWDLDGTLLDSLGVLEGGLATVLPKYQRQLPSHEKIALNFHGSLEDSIRNMLGDVEDDELAAIVSDFWSPKIHTTKSYRSICIKMPWNSHVMRTIAASSKC